MSSWDDKKIIAKKRREIADKLKLVGEFVEGAAKLKCPVGTPESTGIKGYVGGRLRGSITHKVNKRDLSVKVGTNVEYARYVEFGTGERSIKKGFKGLGINSGGRRGMRAQPYLRPALYESKSAIRRILRIAV